MFNGSAITHNKFGKGIITAFNVNAENELDSKVTVTFESGEVKKFGLKSIDGFLQGLSDEELSYIKNLKEEQAKKEEEARKALAEKCRNIPKYDYDENGVEVTLDMWKKAYEVAGDYRFAYESRAVVMNEDLVFINATAGCKYIGLNHKSATKLYKACEIGSKEFGEHWTYASKEVIKNIIDKWGENEEA